jgi:hypothetical protein
MEIKLPTDNPSKRNVIEYLINKLESRAKYMRKVRLATISLKSVNDFFENKKHMMKIFSEIEDDLNQGACALKVIHLQNKDLSEQIHTTSRQTRYEESKVPSEDIAVKELEDRNNNLRQEMDGLMSALEEKDGIINELSEAVSKLEGIVEQQQGDDNREELINRLLEENEFLKKQAVAVRKESNKADGSLKNLLEAKESNKMLINEKIKNFFNKPSQNSQVHVRSSQGANKDFQLQDTVIDKISSSDDVLIHITKTFGQDFMNRLLNEQLEHQYLRLVDQTIINFEEDQPTTKTKHCKTEYHTIKEENEESNSTGYMKESLRSLKKNLSKTDVTFKRSNSTSQFQNKGTGIKPFEKLLRSYNKCLAGNRKNIFTTTSSDYFDKGLATGGISKLDYSDTIRKRNIKKKLTYA